MEVIPGGCLESLGGRQARLLAGAALETGNVYKMMGVIGKHSRPHLTFEPCSSSLIPNLSLNGERPYS